MLVRSTRARRNPGRYADLTRRSRVHRRRLQLERLEDRVVLSAVAPFDPLAREDGAVLRGVTYEDVDGNGVRDAGEGPLAGVTVYLDLDSDGALGADEPRTVTDANGQYTFGGLEPGDYMVREVVPENYRQTSPTLSTPRLFAAVINNTGGNDIVEIDVQTGAAINTFASPGSSSGSTNGLAFDGHALWVANAISDALFKVDPDSGAVVGTIPLASGRWDGAAVLDGLVYVHDPLAHVIRVYDSSTGTVVREIAIDRQSNYQPFGALGELTRADGSAALIAPIGLSTGVAFLDPQTGSATGSFSHIAVSNGRAFGAAGIGGEIFLGFDDPAGTVLVYTESGGFLRTFQLGSRISALGGSESVGEGAHRVTVVDGQTVQGLDFGNRSLLGRLQGTVWEDQNGDGLRDQSEPVLGSVTVYVDLNRNGQRDPEEPTAVTAPDGSYVFRDLAHGEYLVRQEVPDGYRQLSLPTQDFYYALARPAAELVKLDAVSGAVTPIGPHGAGTILHGLVVTNSGQLFAISGNDPDRFWSIDPNTGRATLVGATGRHVGFGLAYDPASDTIYGVAQVADGRNGLVSYDRTTGAAVPISSQGIYELSGTSGIAFDPQGNRVLVYNFYNGEIYQFLPDGTGRLLSQTTAGLGVNLTFVDGRLVMLRFPSGGQTQFIAIDPETGQIENLLTSDQSLTADTLEFVRADPLAHAVLAIPGQPVGGLDFGNQRLNQAPIAVDDAAETDQDVPVTIDVLGNDQDVDGTLDSGSVTVIDGPAHGTTSVDPDTGQITYTPAAGFYGSDAFVYQVSDDRGATAAAAVTVLVHADLNPRIDILPSDPTNTISADLKQVEVAILSTPSFDARTIDINSLTFGRIGDEDSIVRHPKQGVRYSLVDVDGDGRLDLVVQFELARTGLSVGDEEAILKGRTLDGRSFEARDAVTILASTKGSKGPKGNSKAAGADAVFSQTASDETLWTLPDADGLLPIQEAGKGGKLK